MENTFIDLLTTKGALGILVAFLLFVIALLKIVFDMYKVCNKEKNELSKEVIAVILKYEHKIDADKKDVENINSKLDALQKHIYERNR